jgi:UDP-N-acetylmuramate: L-alanyl-gamma-D-glutamyl-meso-diaminopimelate ligase
MFYEVDYAHSYSGICGTFMGSMAVLAKELGHHVTGSDANVYPPMSTQLEAQGIELTQGYDPPSWIRRRTWW